jgi:hypothetical protein
MPVATFHFTDITLDYDGTRLRLWRALPDAVGDVHCVLVRASDLDLDETKLITWLGGMHCVLVHGDDDLDSPPLPVVGMFAVHSSLAHTLPADLAKYAQLAIDRL